MSNLLKLFNQNNYKFSDVLFRKLMQYRIVNILIYCSNYNYYMLEEEGLLEDKLQREYFALNLSNPPRFIQTSNKKDALLKIKQYKIDLIIVMSNYDKEKIIDTTLFFRQTDCNVPIVTLSHIAWDDSLLINKSWDYSFCWFGNADLLLAIVKLAEDKLNSESDIGEMSSQAILLIDDSPKIYSKLLPFFYSLVLQQAGVIMKDGITDYEKRLRMRGRPKILLATNFEEASSIFSKYGESMLGVVVDGTFSINGFDSENAGLMFVEKMRASDCNIPVLMYSYNDILSDKLLKLNIDYINKNQSDSFKKISDFFMQKLAFGEFCFKTQTNGEVIARANNLSEMLTIIENIDIKSIKYHAERGSFTRWFKAKALFQLAELSNPLKSRDFDDTEDIRLFLKSVITVFLSSEAIGKIEKYNYEKKTSIKHIQKLGTGYIGGKARGLAFFDQLFVKNKPDFNYENLFVAIPQTLIIGADVFNQLITANEITTDNFRTYSDADILNYFLRLELSNAIEQSLLHYLQTVSKPIVIRSSSVLEDSYYRSFAGIYSTHFVVNNADKTIFLKQTISAILAVYASVFFESAKKYCNAVPELIESEQMAIVIQEACGERVNDIFYPVVSGIARSKNMYPFPPEKCEQGVVQIAIGLGETISDGGISLRFNPKFPQKCVQLSTLEQALKSTQNSVKVLNCNSKPDFLNNNINEIALRKLPFVEGIEYATSVYDMQNNVLYDGILTEGKKVATFSSLLTHNIFPISDAINKILNLGEQEFNNPVEIEFAMEFDTKNKLAAFYLLQIRPFSISGKYGKVEIPEAFEKKAYIRSNHIMGHGVYQNIKHIVYLSPRKYSSSEFIEIADFIERFNNECIVKNEKFILVGPGRWGSADSNLGCPVKWTAISQATLLVEIGVEGFVIDPSYGSHFFHNIANFNVGYFTSNLVKNASLIDFDKLSQSTISKNHDKVFVAFNPSGFNIYIDSEKSIGMVV